MSTESVPEFRSNPIPFDPTKILAVGSHCIVVLARNGLEPKLLAVKRVQLSVDEDQQQKEVSELDKLVPDILKLKHPNVVHHISTQLWKSTDMTKPSTYDIIMEFCPGETLENATKKIIMPILLQRWIRDILEGLKFIHKQNIVHRNVKTDNIFLSHPDFELAVLKIGDLGNFKQLLINQTKVGEVSSIKSTTNFMSPEMTQRNPENLQIGRRTDIWSLGCVIIQMITGEMPQFSVHNQDRTKRKLQGTEIENFVSKGGLPDIPALEGTSAPLDQFLRRCLISKQDQRPWARDLLSDPFLYMEVDDITLPEREMGDNTPTLS